MSFSKVIPLGNNGQIEIKEEGGKGSVALSIGGSVGGGSVEGALKGKASVEVDADALMLVLAALEAAKAKWPSIAAAVELAEVAIKSEAAKV